MKQRFISLENYIKENWENQFDFANNQPTWRDPTDYIEVGKEVTIEGTDYEVLSIEKFGKDRDGGKTVAKMTVKDLKTGNPLKAKWNGYMHVLENLNEAKDLRTLRNPEKSILGQFFKDKKNEESWAVFVYHNNGPNWNIGYTSQRFWESPKDWNVYADNLSKNDAIEKAEKFLLDNEDKRKRGESKYSDLRGDDAVFVGIIEDKELLESKGYEYLGSLEHPDMNEGIFYKLGRMVYDIGTSVGFSVEAGERGDLDVTYNRVKKTWDFNPNIPKSLHSKIKKDIFSIINEATTSSKCFNEGTVNEVKRGAFDGKELTDKDIDDYFKTIGKTGIIGLWNNMMFHTSLTREELKEIFAERGYDMEIPKEDYKHVKFVGYNKNY